MSHLPHEDSSAAKKLSGLGMHSPRQQDQRPAYYIAAEVGASSINIQVRDEKGAVVCESKNPDIGASLAACSGEEAWKRINTCIQKTLQGSGITLDKSKFRFYGCIGIPGVSIEDSLKQLKQQAAAPFEQLTVESDVAITHLGIFQGKPGAVYILGTGAMGLWLNADKMTRKGSISYPYLPLESRVGGLGGLVDGGDAWLGRKILEELTTRISRPAKSELKTVAHSKALTALFNNLTDIAAATMSQLTEIIDRPAREVRKDGKVDEKQFSKLIEIINKPQEHETSKKVAIYFIEMGRKLGDPLVDEFLRSAAEKFCDNFASLQALAEKDGVPITEQSPAVTWGGFWKYVSPYVSEEIRKCVRNLEDYPQALKPVDGASLKAMLDRGITLPIALQRVKPQPAPALRAAASAAMAVTS